MHSRSTPHNSPSRASYGVSFVSFLQKNDRNISRAHCNISVSLFCSFCSSRVAAGMCRQKGKSTLLSWRIKSLWHNYTCLSSVFAVYFSAHKPYSIIGAISSKWDYFVWSDMIFHNRPVTLLSCVELWNEETRLYIILTLVDFRPCGVCACVPVYPGLPPGGGLFLIPSRSGWCLARSAPQTEKW